MVCDAYAFAELVDSPSTAQVRLLASPSFCALELELADSNPLLQEVEHGILCRLTIPTLQGRIISDAPIHSPLLIDFKFGTYPRVFIRAFLWARCRVLRRVAFWGGVVSSCLGRAILVL